MMNNWQPLLDFFASYVDAERGVGDWSSEWSWVAAIGIEQWIATADLNATTEVYLLEEKQGSLKPLRVVFGVRIVQAGCLIFCFLDAENIYPTVAALVSRISDAGLPRALLGSPSGALTWTGQRILHAGIVYDPEMSVRLAQALAERFGTFSVKWLLAMDEKGGTCCDTSR